MKMNKQCFCFCPIFTKSQLFVLFSKFGQLLIFVFVTEAMYLSRSLVPTEVTVNDYLLKKEITSSIVRHNCILSEMLLLHSKIFIDLTFSLSRKFKFNENYCPPPVKTEYIIPAPAQCQVFIQNFDSRFCSGKNRRFRPEFTPTP